MGYLNLERSAVPDFTKAVISLWFRVPQASIDKCLAAYIPPGPGKTIINGVPGTIYQQVPDGAVGSNVGQTSDAPPFLQPLNGVIPLVTFGEIIDGAYLTKNTGVNVPSGVTSEVWLVVSPCNFSLLSSSTVDQFEQTTTTDQTYTRDPSYIGIDCSQDTPVLRVNLQTADFPEMSNIFAGVMPGNFNSGLIKVAEGVTTDPGGGLCSGLIPLFLLPPDPDAGQPVNPGFADAPFNSTTTYSDNADFYKNAYPEVFGGSSPTITITPDQWHCLILSFDLTGEVNATGTVSGDDAPATMSSSCKMWVALDDVNYTDFDLPTANWSIFGGDGPPPAPIDGAGPNDIFTIRAIETYGFFVSPANESFDDVERNGQWGHTTITGAGNPATYSFSPSGLPCNKQPIGIPASADFVDNIYKVEMAEFQMFTGVTLDTGVEANRRAFIAPDKNGRLLPVNPFAVGSLSDPTAGLDPTSFIAPPAPQKLLGQKPDIALTSSSFNWIGGVNTGTAAKAGGKFKATGTIKPFLPNPVVGK